MRRMRDEQQAADGSLCLHCGEQRCRPAIARVDLQRGFQLGSQFSMGNRAELFFVTCHVAASGFSVTSIDLLFVMDAFCAHQTCEPWRAPGG